MCQVCLACDDETHYPEHMAVDIFYASGKGKGSGKKGKPNQERKNPVKTGEVLRCYLCGSEYHLASKCPDKNRRQQQHLQNAQSQSRAIANYRPPAQKSPGKTTVAGAPQPQFSGYGPPFTIDGPPMTLHYQTVNQQPTVSEPTSTSKSAIATAKERGQTTKHVRFEAPSTAHASTETEVEINLVRTFGQAMEDGTQTAKADVKREFSKTSTTQVLAAHSSPIITDEEIQMVYETRLEDGDEGILIDTGAAINCVGGHFCDRYNALMEERGAPPTE